jgi:ADP-ribosylglycohydrolase
MMDRVSGVLLGQACGDALGVPYEFGPSLDADFEPVMSGGGPFGFAPGEYSDDTAMAVCIANVAAAGVELTSASALDQIASNFMTWAASARDVGNQTRAVLSKARGASGSPGSNAANAASAYIAVRPDAAGNGALMRTAVVALAGLNDRAGTAEAAKSIASLTHAGPLSVDSCILWTEAVRVAVTERRFDLQGGLDLVDSERRDQWRGWIEEATCVDPRTFNRNGYTVAALQAAWAAITWTPVPELDLATGRFPAQHLEIALKNAVRAGDDTDTVAAIAGGLLGGFWGQSAVPLAWTREVHGYGECRAHDLVSMAVLAGASGRPDDRGWPGVHRVHYGSLAPSLRVPHPHDPGVILGSYADLADHGCDAVISLCRVGHGDRKDAGNLGADHLEVRLIDSEASNANPNLAFVLLEVVQTIKHLREEGKTVFVHCVRAEQRTPAVAVAYSRLLAVDDALAKADVLAVLPSASGRGLLWDAASNATVRKSVQRAPHWLTP